jgi:hypothetical protein
MIQILMVSIAAWYPFRGWRDRRAAKEAEQDLPPYRPYEGI